MSIFKSIDNFYKMANKPFFFSSQLKYDKDSMRDESFNYLRKNNTNKPIEIEVYEDTGPILADGRHRLQIAREQNKEYLNTIVRYYDLKGNVIDEFATKLIIDD